MADEDDEYYINNELLQENEDKEKQNNNDNNNNNISNDINLNDKNIDIEELIKTEITNNKENVKENEENK